MDAILVHSLKKHHMNRLDSLGQTLVKHGLKLYPKKYQLFIKELDYMGNVFMIEDQRMTIWCIKCRIEVVQMIFPLKC